MTRKLTVFKNSTASLERFDGPLLFELISDNKKDQLPPKKLKFLGEKPLLRNRLAIRSIISSRSASLDVHERQLFLRGNRAKAEMESR
ncbi:hypothetical protein AVEN_65888-1 [Araneus ventricosus]|uniref:Uncharacterized protein n=1 Tax=Araneus ventricosus TaxID=182803 RepID=A0A4Y2HE83_ARAVE|nr:hypothetical protein AVEN_65888-1 [Araneus ventricosus]